MTRTAMTRADWRRLAEPTLLAGTLRYAELPEGWPEDGDLLAELLRFKADLIARGDHRLTFLALQACLGRSRRVTVAGVVAEIGDDARTWRWSGGAAGALELLRDSWSVPAFGAVRWSMRTLTDHDRLWRAEQRLRRMARGDELPRALIDALAGEAA